jgi:hypothetical protein
VGQYDSTPLLHVLSYSPQALHIAFLNDSIHLAHSSTLREILSREAACAPSFRTRHSGDVSPPCSWYPRGTRLHKAKYTCSASTAPMAHLLCVLSCLGGVRLRPIVPAVHAYSPSTTILAQLAHIKLVDDARDVRSLHMNTINFAADPTLTATAGRPDERGMRKGGRW